MNWGVIFLTPVLQFFSCILYLINSYKTIYEIIKDTTDKKESF